MGVSTRDNSKAIFQKYEEYFRDDVSLEKSARKGLKADAAFDFISLSELAVQEIEIILNKSIKTFNNYKERRTNLDPVTSEKLLKLFYLYHKGSEVFGSAHQFNEWMGLKAFGLGDQVPIKLLNTITGIDLIAEEVSRIAYGDLA